MRAWRLMAIAALLAVGCLVLMLASGCASLGLAGPRTFDEQLASAQIGETAVVNAATAAVNAGTLSSSSAQHVLDTAKTMDGFVAAAKTAAAAGNSQTAQNNMALVMSTLAGLQSFVNSETKPKGGGR